MADESKNLASREQRIDEVIAEYLDALDAGKTVDQQAFLARHADVAEEIEAFLADRERFANMAGAMADEAPRANKADTPTLAPRTQQFVAEGSEAIQVTEPMLETAFPTAGRTFGDYELLEEIARGGMGVVFRARQVTLNRIVAIKMILAGQLASADDVKRFYSEAQTAANLQHPNIVAIHEVGQHEGQHYFSMDYVEGQSLAELVRENPMSPREAAEHVRVVAEAIHFAHGKGVLHRDLKPHNVLIDQNGAPRVTDFGLAKRFAASPERERGEHLTATGAVVGTPSYMPPEQASGRRGLLSPASDVYSLGAILYDLVTGRPPFRAATPLDTLLQVLETEPAAPRLLNPTVPRDLETIILKCLAKDPKKRYGTAKALGEDLEAYMEGRHIKARRPSLAERGVRWLRNQGRTVKVALWVAGLVTVAIFGINWYRDLRQGRILITSQGPPLSAEILADDRDEVVGQRFTVPTQEPISLAAGNYRLRLMGPQRPSEIMHFRVEAGDKVKDEQGNLFKQRLNVELKSRALGEPIKVPEQFELLNLAGRPAPGERPSARHDLITVTKRGLARMDGTSGETVWDVSLAAADQPALKNEPLFSFSAVLKPGMMRREPSSALAVGDIDGDGVNDFIWCSRQTESLLAVSGNEGKVLWWSYPMLGLPAGLDRKLIKDFGVNSGLPLGAVVGMPVLHSPEPAPGMAWLLAGCPLGLAPLHAAVGDLAERSAQGPILLATMERLHRAQARIPGQKPKIWKMPGGAEVVQPPQDEFVQIKPAKWIEAIHLGTGQTRWRHVFPNEWFPENTPRNPFHPAQLGMVNGKLTLLCLVGANETHVVGLDPDTGKERWPPVRIEIPVNQRHDADPIADWFRFVDLDGDGQAELMMLQKSSSHTNKAVLRVLALPSGKTLWTTTVIGEWFASQDPIGPVGDGWVTMPVPWEQSGSEWPLIIPPTTHLQGERVERTAGAVVIPLGDTKDPNKGRENIALLDGATGKERWTAPLLPVVKDSRSGHGGYMVQARRLEMGPDLDGDGRPEIFRVLCVSNTFYPDIGVQYELMVDALSGADGRRLWLWRQKLPGLQRQHLGINLRPLRWLPVAASRASTDTGSVESGGPALLVPCRFQEGNTVSERSFLVSATSGRLLQEIPDLSLWLPPRDMDGDGLLDLIGWRQSEWQKPSPIPIWERTGQPGSLHVLRMYSPEVWRRAGNWKALWDGLPIRPTDFDGDGTPDLINPAPGPMTAVSGADGRLLWRSGEKGDNPSSEIQWSHGNSFNAPAIPCPDIDGDGQADLLVFQKYSHFLGAGNVLCALSGKTGALLWSADDLKKDERSISGYLSLTCQVLDPSQGPEIIFLFPSNPHRDTPITFLFPSKLTRTIDDKEGERVVPGLRLAILSLRTGKIRWQQRLPQGIANIAPLSWPGLADVNGDGVRDLLFPWVEDGKSKLLALDGRTGQFLWFSQGGAAWPATLERAATTERGRPFVEVGDLNGDGRDDLVMKILNGIQAISGKDGQVLWTWSFPAHHPSYLMHPLLFRVGRVANLPEAPAGRRPAPQVVVAVSLYDARLQRKEVPGGFLDTEQGHWLVFLNSRGKEIGRRLIPKKAPTKRMMPGQPAAGFVLWTEWLDSTAVPIWAADVDGDGQDEVLVIDRGKLVAAQPNGQTLWESPILGQESQVLALLPNPDKGKGMTIAVQCRDAVFGVSGSSGKILWRCDGPGENVQLLASSDGRLPRVLWHVNKEPSAQQGGASFQFVACRQALPTTADGEYPLLSPGKWDGLPIRPTNLGSYDEVEFVDYRRLPWVEQYARDGNYYNWQTYGLVIFGCVVLVMGLTNGRRGVVSALTVWLIFTSIYVGFAWFTGGPEHPLQPWERYVWTGWHVMFIQPGAVAGGLLAIPVVLYCLFALVAGWWSGWRLSTEQKRKQRRRGLWIGVTVLLLIPLAGMLPLVLLWPLLYRGAEAPIGKAGWFVALFVIVCSLILFGLFRLRRRQRRERRGSAP